MTPMSSRTKFIDPKVVDETLAEVANIARLEGVKVVVIGGVAMMVYGSDRMTKDVDVATVDEYLAELTPIRQLTFGGFVGRTPGGREVDLVVRSDDYRDLYEEAVSLAGDEGLPLLVVSPEHLLALKMAAGRGKDELDVKFLLGSGRVDYTAARWIVKKYLGEYAARVLDSLRDEVEWTKSRGADR